LQRCNQATYKLWVAWFFVFLLGEDEVVKQRVICRVVWGLMLVVLLLVACGSEEGEVPESTKSPLPTPIAETPASSPIQTPSAGLPNWDADPEPGKAILRGRIELTQPSALLGELFLAKVVPTSDPNIGLLELDEEAASRASIDRDTWQFIFLNVEPGKYGVIAWEPMNSSPLNDPATGETLMLELLADQVTDVGTLSFP
jgi:hypothetical protein